MTIKVPEFSRPLERGGDTTHFYANPLVRRLFDRVIGARPDFDLANFVRNSDARDEDRRQFLQLLGLPVETYGAILRPTPQHIEALQRECDAAMNPGSTPPWHDTPPEQEIVLPDDRSVEIVLAYPGGQSVTLRHDPHEVPTLDIYLDDDLLSVGYTDADSIAGIDRATQVSSVHVDGVIIHIPEDHIRPKIGHGKASL